MRFNLVNEGWIPVIEAQGGTALHGLKEVFRRASGIKEVSADSPLESAAVMRLLLAVLYRVFGNPSKKEWRGLWERGSFNTAPIDSYLESLEDRFDLFDEEFPFYQSGGLELNKTASLVSLSFADSQTNNSKHFSHEILKRPERAYTPAEAARLLLAYQYFTPNAGNSETGPTKNAPLANIYTIFTRGGNLFETLMLNYARIPDSRIQHNETDRPVWERGPWKPTKQKLTPLGITDYLTWPTRAVRLLPEVDEEGRLFCRYCYRGHGLTCVDIVLEPQTGFSKKVEKGEVSISSWKFNRGRAVWRDSGAIFVAVHSPDAWVPVNSFYWLAELISDGLIPRRLNYEFEVFGYAKKSASQPTVLLWRRERLPLPLAYLEEKQGPGLVGKLLQGLEYAEGVAGTLSYALLGLARLLVKQGEENPYKPLGGEAEKDAKSLRNSFGAETVYWAALEPFFRELLMDIPADPDEALEEWIEVLKREGGRTFDAVARSAGDSARALRAAVKAREMYLSRLYNKEKGVLREWSAPQLEEVGDETR